MAPTSTTGTNVAEEDEEQTAPPPPPPPSEERRVTFRKRRLSLPLHRLSAGDDVQETETAALDFKSPLAVEAPSPHPNHQFYPESPSSSINSEKAQTFRKRRLSLTQNRQLFQDDNNDSSFVAKRIRRMSECSATSAGSNLSSGTPLLRPKTMHSGELLREGDSPPPSPAVHSDNILYTRQSLPPPPPLELPATMDAATEASLSPGGTNHCHPLPSSHLQPKWRKRQTVGTGDEHKLPFPRDIVGTYSCHGSEPVYDSNYEEDDDDNEVEDETDSWTNTTNDAINGGILAEGGKPAAVAEMAAKEEKPTTAAKINQDRGGVAFPYGNNKRTALFAVYDGHGQGGEQVSQFALHEIQRRLEKHPLFKTDLEKAFKETFVSVDEALNHEPLIEPFFAGTTACVALLSNNRLSLANAGDSRAVLARKVSSDSPDTCWEAINLTEDQNPDLPHEMQRITSAGGFVSPPPAPGLSARVWLDPNCTQIGLAMARSIGDHAVSTVGVIAEPEVTFHELQEDDDFMIIASDGVWEFLESDDAVKIVGDNLDRGATKACQALIEAAAAKWHEEEGEYRDDITAIVVRLQHLWKNKKVT